jgi:hypothetical protein
VPVRGLFRTFGCEVTLVESDPMSTFSVPRRVRRGSGRASLSHANFSLFIALVLLTGDFCVAANIFSGHPEPKRGPGLREPTRSKADDAPTPYPGRVPPFQNLRGSHLPRAGAAAKLGSMLLLFFKALLKSEQSNVGCNHLQACVSGFDWWVVG